MTLDEAIQHARDKAKELGDCECAKEHLQLVRWLKELKAYREVYQHWKDADSLLKEIDVDAEVGKLYRYLKSTNAVAIKFNLSKFKTENIARDAEQLCSIFAYKIPLQEVVDTLRKVIKEDGE